VHCRCVFVRMMIQIDEWKKSTLPLFLLLKCWNWSNGCVCCRSFDYANDEDLKIVLSM
jgi:hypothetical protein